MKRYDDCPYENSECRKCSLSSRELDCHGYPAPKLEYYMYIGDTTQKELASKVDMTQQAISRFVTGDRDLGNASARTVAKIAAALGTTVEDLLDDP